MENVKLFHFLLNFINARIGGTIHRAVSHVLLYIVYCLLRKVGSDISLFAPE